MALMGIDGGGTSLRVVIVDDDLREIALAINEGVNPNSVGRELATERIQYTIRQALESANLSDVDAVGIGIAGASADHSAEWLRAVVSPVLPQAQLVPSSDLEIALVGGRGQADGLLLLAGTGSAVLGIASDGRRKQVGGWGYLLDDEGSAYWIGLEALRLVMLTWDGRLQAETELPKQVLEKIGATSRLEILRWVYQIAKPSEIASLTPLVMEAAEQDHHARSILDNAAQKLVALAGYAMAELAISPEAIVFGGGLLTAENILSRQVATLLGLSELPLPRYSPMIGAALLAKLQKEK